MRATSPLDPIQDFGDFVELPAPRYAVGMRISLDAMDSRDRRYHWSQAVRALVRDMRRIVDRLRRQGYLAGMTSRRMLEHNKSLIRSRLDMIRFADSVELAGCSPRGMHVVGTVANQCYLKNGQCHSGVDYEYYLLFRRTVEGHKLVYVHPYPVLGECEIRPVEAP